MKKILALVIAAVFVMSVCSCSSDSGEAYALYANGIKKNASLTIKNLSLEIDAISGDKEFLRAVSIKSEKNGNNVTASIESDDTVLGVTSSSNVYYSSNKAYIDNGIEKYITDDDYNTILSGYTLLSETELSKKMFSKATMETDKKGIKTVKFDSAADEISKSVAGHLKDVATTFTLDLESELEKANISVELKIDNNGYLTDWNYNIKLSDDNGTTIKAKNKLIYPGEFVLIKKPDDLDMYTEQIRDTTETTTTATDSGTDETGTTVSGTTGTLTDEQNDIISSVDDMKLGDIDKEMLKSQIAEDLKAGTTTLVTTTATSGSASGTESQTGTTTSATNKGAQ